MGRPAGLRLGATQAEESAGLAAGLAGVVQEEAAIAMGSPHQPPARPAPLADAGTMATASPRAVF